MSRLTNAQLTTGFQIVKILPATSGYYGHFFSFILMFILFKSWIAL